jgi:predicted TPR repeat methyltransferase
LAHINGRRERAREAYQAYLTFEPGDAEVKQIFIALSDETPPARAPDEFIEQLYARFAKFYEKNMREELVYQGPALISEMLEQFLANAAELDVLELGCGTGMVGQQLRSRARWLTGIDLSPDMVTEASASGIYDELVTAEITAWLATNQAQYDLVVTCDTLIYFGDLRQVVVPVAGHLRPGGWFALSVEKGGSLPFSLADTGRYRHTERHIRAVAGEAGLTVISLQEDFLRNEYGRAVTGIIALLQRPPGK